MDLELVGRDSELAVLSGWLDSVEVRGGRVVLVGGDAGIGKTRLVSALAAHAEAGGPTSALGADDRAGRCAAVLAVAAGARADRRPGAA